MRSSDEADKEAKCIPAHKSACIKQQVTQDRIIAGGVQLGADLHLLLKLFWWRYCPTMRDSKRPADILYEPQRHRSSARRGTRMAWRIACKYMVCVCQN